MELAGAHLLGPPWETRRLERTTDRLSGEGMASHPVSDRSSEFAHLSRVSRLSSTPNRVNLALKIG